MSAEKTHGGLARSTAIIAIATLLSRILGLIRDQVVLSLFPVGVTDPFFVAYRLPNTLRRLFAEGALSAAFIPVFVHSLEKDTREESARFASAIFRFMFLVLGFVSIMGIVLAPMLVRLLAPGFTDTERLELTILLTRIMFPYILLIGLAALTMGMLNSLHRFFMPALSSAFLNLAMILAAGIPFFWPGAGPGIRWLAGGVIVGGILQWGCQWIVLRRELPVRSFGREVMHPLLPRVGRLFLPAFMGQAAVQVNILVDTFFASYIDGANTWLYAANRIMQFPLGVYGIAVATASLPALSGHFSRNDDGAFRRTLFEAYRSIFFILTPAALGLLFFGSDFTGVLFDHGKFRVEGSLQPTVQALWAYSGGLVVFACVKLSASALHATRNTRGPMWAGFASVGLNILLDWLLIKTPLRHAGLALATTLSSGLNLALLFYFLRKHIPFGTLKEPLRVLMRSLILGAAAIGLSLVILGWVLPSDGKTRVYAFRSILGMVLSGVFYGVGAHWFLRTEMIRITRHLCRRSKRTIPGE